MHYEMTPSRYEMTPSCYEMTPSRYDMLCHYVTTDRYIAVCNKAWVC
jgi:hypothetical protein